MIITTIILLSSKQSAIAHGVAEGAAGNNIATDFQRGFLAWG